MRSPNAMTILISGGLAMGSLGSLCNPTSIYLCSSDEDCRPHGAGGRCESNLACSFEDEQCPQGRRWHSRADDEAGACLESGPSATDGSGSDGGDGDASSGGDHGEETQESSAASSEGSEAESGSSESTTEGSTSSGEETSESSTSQEMTTSSETGAAQSCDEQYGSVLDYQLCTETLDTCAFNIRVDMSANCSQVCSMHGSVCVTADLNETEPCVPIGEIPCDDMSFTDAICTCSRD